MYSFGFPKLRGTSFESPCHEDCLGFYMTGVPQIIETIPEHSIVSFPGGRMADLKR